jgi:hypothetical protein
MRVVSVLLLAGIATLPATAAAKDRVWLSGTFGIVTTDDWCKAPLGTRGPCGDQRDSGPPAQQVRSGIDAPGFPIYSSPGSPSIANAVTQLIKVKGPNATYTVKYEALMGQIKSLPNAPVEFAIQGKHLFLRSAGNEYKTNILTVNKRKP